MTTPKQVYQQVLDLFADESRWTRGQQAEDVAGHEVSPTSDEAVRFCATGAVRHFSTAFECVEGTTVDECPKCQLIGRLNKVAERLYNKGIVGVNDVLGIEAVRHVLQEAINEAE